MIAGDASGGYGRQMSKAVRHEVCRRASGSTLDQPSSTTIRSSKRAVGPGMGRHVTEAEGHRR